RALEQSVPVLTEMALFFRLCPATIVGITGTKGKTTTTTLIERVLALGPRPVLVGGNIGHAVIQEVDRLTRNDIVVLELSSFQLETLGHSPPWRRAGVAMSSALRTGCACPGATTSRTRLPRRSSAMPSTSRPIAWAWCCASSKAFLGASRRSRRRTASAG